MAPPLTKKDDDRDDEAEYSPFLRIQKGVILQEARVFNDPHLILEDALRLKPQKYSLLLLNCPSRKILDLEEWICNNYCDSLYLGQESCDYDITGHKCSGREAWSADLHIICYCGLNATVNRRKDEDDLTSGLTHHNFIKCIQSQRFKFRGVNFSGIDLSKLLMNLPCYFRNVLSCHQLSYTEVPTSPKQC